jgi:hypothetical protein
MGSSDAGVPDNGAGVVRPVFVELDQQAAHRDPLARRAMDRGNSAGAR